MVDTALRPSTRFSAEIEPLRAQAIGSPGANAVPSAAALLRDRRVMRGDHLGRARRLAGGSPARIGGALRRVGHNRVLLGRQTLAGAASSARLARAAVGGVEAAKSAARRGSPDHGYYHKLAGKHDGHNGKNPTLAVERKILRRCYHTLRALGDAALAMPSAQPQEVAA